MRQKVKRVAAAASVLVCIAAAAFWVRSYCAADAVSGHVFNTCGIEFSSDQGRIQIGAGAMASKYDRRPWMIYSRDVSLRTFGEEGQPSSHPRDSLFRWHMSRGASSTTASPTRYAKLWEFIVAFPHWVLVIAGGVSLWILQSKQWQFSIRSLLLLTTFVTVTLGIAAVVERLPFISPEDSISGGELIPWW